MPIRPISPAAAVAELVERITRIASPGPATRVIIDGAPPAGPGQWADAMVDPLRLHGRPVLRASATDFLRPASLRFEHGRHDPRSLLAEWLDASALRRELLGPAGPGGTGRVLLRWWDPVTDRSPRADYVDVQPGSVLLLDGTLLLGRDLPAELTVHLHLAEPALRRNTTGQDAWTLPAYRDYAEQARPQQAADVVLYVDHQDRPAILDR